MSNLSKIIKFGFTGISSGPTIVYHNIQLLSLNFKSIELRIKQNQKQVKYDTIMHISKDSYFREDLKYNTIKLQPSDTYAYFELLINDTRIYKCKYIFYGEMIIHFNNLQNPTEDEINKMYKIITTQYYDK